MAFFTRVNLNVPVLPPEELVTEGTCSATSHTHKKYASEPVTSVYGSFINSSTTRPNVPGESVLPATTSSNVADRNAANIIMIANEDEIALSNVDSKSVNAKGRPVETGARSSENGETEALSKSAEKNGNGEPKRYEYVVDRVLGVEV